VGSISDEIIGFFNCPINSSFIMAVRLTQSLTDRSKMNLLGRKCGERIGLTTSQSSVSRWPRQCGVLNISQPYRPPRPVTGIALLHGDGVCFLLDTNWTVSTATSSQYLAVNYEPIV
jgi:hypothetical protein